MWAKIDTVALKTVDRQKNREPRSELWGLNRLEITASETGGSAQQASGSRAIGQFVCWKTENSSASFIFETATYGTGGCNRVGHIVSVKLGQPTGLPR